MNEILNCKTYEEVVKLTEHEDWEVRLYAYRALGFTEKAFDDKDWIIRLLAYRTLGFNENALSDEDADIRLEAQKYFHIKKLREDYERNFKL